VNHVKATNVSRFVRGILHQAGDILVSHFGRIAGVRTKGHPSSVVCAADLASEAYLVSQLRRRFPEDSIIAEESGYLPGTSEFTWVIDPLDGTSNFVSRLPWFGVQLGRLHRGKPVLAAIYVPLDKSYYYAEAGQGLSQNGKSVELPQARRLDQVLCAFGFDPSANERQSRRNSALLRRVAQGVRNIRSTNSLIDFCYTLEGRFGACVNLHTKIWDIVPISLLLPEAGGKFTDLLGRPISFDLGANTFGRSYAIAGANHSLHRQLLALIKRPNSSRSSRHPVRQAREA
jgi:myo-inositol-1(or 4)-monophosphatase